MRNLCCRAETLYVCTCVCTCVFLPAQGEVLEMELWKQAVALLCVSLCVSMCGTWAPPGQKNEKTRKNDNNNNDNDTVGSAEPHANMDIAEISHAIMTAFMHFFYLLCECREGGLKWEKLTKKGQGTIVQGNRRMKKRKFKDIFITFPRNVVMGQGIGDYIAVRFWILERYRAMQQSQKPELCQETFTFFLFYSHLSL